MRLFFILACLLMVGAEQPAAVKDLSLRDTKGKLRSAAEWKDAKAVVLLFLGTECPVSNGYAPEYARLEKNFAPKGVRFYGIHADPEVTGEAAAKHAAEYGLNFPILLDPSQQVARQAGVKT